jgi:hypothetical protein
VDVDQTLAGIDKLLGSQELTFAFVGVATTLSLTYAVGGYLGRRFASKSNGGGRRWRRRGIMHHLSWLTERRMKGWLWLTKCSVTNFKKTLREDIIRSLPTKPGRRHIQIQYFNRDIRTTFIVAREATTV